MRELYRPVSLIPYALICFILCIPVLAAAAPPPAAYQLHKKIMLGGEGGWDYFEVDPDSGHVFIPRDSHILVVDAEGRQVADIPGVNGAHAIVFAPDIRKAFLSTEGSVSVLDVATLKIADVIRLPGKDPDAILYDPFSKRVFTFNGGGTKDATTIDAVTGKVLGSIPLGGKPEFAQTDGEGRIYVNVEDKSRVTAFDSRTLKVLNSWPIPPCREPSGLAIDVVHKRLFAGCHNGLMAAVDYTSGKVVSTVPIGRGVDANRFDPSSGLVFASCGEGVITVADQDSTGNLSVVQTIQTQQGARTMALDAKNHNVYTVTAQFGPPPPATPDNPHPYPSVISKTSTLLIFAR
jgi:DNA-binding beta-propeller fold protein YncE